MNGYPFNRAFRKNVNPEIFNFTYHLFAYKLAGLTIAETKGVDVDRLFFDRLLGSLRCDSYRPILHTLGTTAKPIRYPVRTETAR